MITPGLKTIAGLLLVGLAQPVLAQERQAYTVGTCAIFCSGSGPTSGETAAAPPAPYVMSLTPDEVEPPVPSKIVAARGVVMAETAAERVSRRRQYASMVKRIIPPAAQPEGSKDPKVH